MAFAAGPLGPNGSRIETSDFSVDLSPGAVLAGSRVTGLGGAYVALAEGTDGDLQNAAAPAVRSSYSVDYFDYELGLGLTFPSSLDNSDFFNTGQPTELPETQQDDAVFVVPALNLQWGSFGVGAIVEIQNYVLERREPTESGQPPEGLEASIIVGHLQFAQALFAHQLIVGAGLRGSTLNIAELGPRRDTPDLFTTTGAGLEVGVLIRPTGYNFRIGAAFRSAINTKATPDSAIQANAEGDRIVGGEPGDASALYLPNRVTAPWDLNVGFSVQLGPRPLNPHFSHASELAEAILEGQPPKRRKKLDEDAIWANQRRRLKRRYQSFSRHYLLISTSLVVIGRVHNAVGVESFLQRRVNRSGEHIVFSPRLGLEGEPVQGWVAARLGTYGEPSRFRTGAARLHATMGIDVKVLPWSVFGLFDEDAFWKISSSADVARRYLSWGIGIGLWH